MKESYTPQELELMLGESIKALRLQKNLDRKTLCARAGTSLNALRHLEDGKGATIKTLIRVVRALDRQAWFEGIAPKVSINPLHMVKENRPRQRARKRSKSNGKKEKS